MTFEKLSCQTATKKQNWNSAQTDSWIKLGRLAVFGLLGLALCLGLSLRLVHLQVVHGSEYRARSNNNRVVLKTIPAARGGIYDRNGQLLTNNVPIYKRITNDQGVIFQEPPVLTRAEALQLEATSSGQVLQTVGRTYPLAEASSHVLGYVSEANAEEIEAYGLQLGELVGKSGLEKEYNQVLIGKPGSELLELNAKGVLLRNLGSNQPVPGENLHLNLDSQLQQIMYQALNQRLGSAVATNPQTGEVLGLVSSPGFDPNLFGPAMPGTRHQTAAAVRQILQDPQQPMLNRAISGAYPPGSVYKVVPAIAGLETQTIDAETEVEDSGVLTVDDYQYRNWFYTQYGQTDGSVNVRKALQRSNDIYFYKLGEWLGPNALAEWSRNFGLGKPTGIELSNEAAGLVPDPIWKERYRNEPWYLGNTYHMSIGQGDLLTTPIQVNQMMAAVANGGRWCKPKLVKQVGERQAEGVECIELGLDQDNLDQAVEGLVSVCDPGGTAYPFFDFNLSEFDSSFEADAQVACKTGTAQYSNPEDKTHAWFTIFYPIKNPEFMLTVMLEGAGEGSQEAAPAAYQIITEYLQATPAASLD